MFTNFKSAVPLTVSNNTMDVVELDLDTLSIVGGGDGSTSFPVIGGNK
jgi:hypothetical protein